MPQDLPIPPPLMRSLVGPTAEADFDNPSGNPVIDGLPDSAWEAVLDFGCGCGRLARQMLQQVPRPKQYLGIDLHAGMIRWCQENLSSHAENFRFLHQDVFNAGLNPLGRVDRAAFPVADRSITLVIGWSVFTHLLEDPAIFYLAETARVLRPDGFALLSFFLFDKSEFPMMQEFQNALYINSNDPTNAVIVDRTWLLRTTARVGLVLTGAAVPSLRGYQWLLQFRPAESGVRPIELPQDTGPRGRLAPPLMPPGADRLGLDS